MKIKRNILKALLTAVACWCALWAIGTQSHTISVVDVMLGQVRVVASEDFPAGEKVEIVQYWNDADGYTLAIRHRTMDQKVYWAIIDPDCLRIPRCESHMITGTSLLTVTAPQGIRGEYDRATRQLHRKDQLVNAFAL